MIMLLLSFKMSTVMFFFFFLSCFQSIWCNVSLLLVAPFMHPKLYAEKEFICKWVYVNAYATLWTCYEYVMILDEKWTKRKERKGNDCMKEWKVLKYFLGHMKLCAMVPKLMGRGSHLIWFVGNGVLEYTIYQVMFIS